MDRDLYDETVHAIYDAALQPDCWPSVLRRFSSLFDVRCSLLFTLMHAPAQGGFGFADNLSPAMQELWAAKTVHEDPFAKAIVEKGLAFDGSAVLDRDLITMDELLRSSLYKDMWSRMDIGRMCGGLVFGTTDARKLPTAVSMLRSLADPPFVRADADLLARLLRHLSRALGVMYHLRDNQLQLAASRAALDQMSCGVVLLDGARRMQFANAAAQAMFSQADPVALHPAGAASAGELRLHPRLAAYEPRLQRAVVQALQPLVADVEEHFSEALVLPDVAGRPVCVVHAAPLADASRLGAGVPSVRAIVFLYDLLSAASVQPEVLCRLFGMTPAEARAALQVTQGGSAEQMARALGVSLPTFKSQLQAAYDKSGTHRRADLLKLLLALASR